MLKIDADALFRAITATGYKLLAYNLDIRTGAIVSRTLSAAEVPSAPLAPSVKPLPKLGADLSPKKEASPFGPPPSSSKPKLFQDNDTKKPAFGGDFWKRDNSKKPAPFGEYKRESGSKKLAEIFGDSPRPKATPPIFADKPVDLPPAAKNDAPIPTSSADPYYPRIPAATEDTQLDWMRHFAKDAGDPQIRAELLAALNGPKAASQFERALRSHGRTEQQWERYLRKQALGTAEAWLKTLGITWELVEQI